MTEYESNVTGDDSLEVVKLVDTFFEYIENGQPMEAAAMLYRVNLDDPNNEPEVLSNEELQKMHHNLSAFPIIRHHIDYIKFHEAHENEVKCTVIIADATDDMPEVKTVYYLKPVEHIAKWYLCLMNTATGDDAIVAPEDRDSMASNYKK